MLAAGLASPADNAGGIAAATASPALSYQIGQYFKANDLKNQADGGQRPGESSPAHLLAHSILGAAVAASGSHNALSGALSAGGAEAAAPVLSRWLYGKAAADLTADEKQTVAGISGLLGAGIGAAAGNSSEDTVSGSLSADISVQDNEMAGIVFKDSNFRRREFKQLQDKYGSNINEIVNKINNGTFILGLS